MQYLSVVIIETTRLSAGRSCHIGNFIQLMGILQRLFHQEMAKRTFCLLELCHLDTPLTGMWSWQEVLFYAPKILIEVKYSTRRPTLGDLDLIYHKS